MKNATTAVQMLIRLSGLGLIVLGVLFWTGNALVLVPVHMLLGAAFVLFLWTLAIMAARAGANRGQAALAMAWGLLTLLLGMTHAQILAGPAHWLVQVLHLLVGLAAIGLGEVLAAGIASAARTRRALAP